MERVSAAHNAGPESFFTRKPFGRFFLSQQAIQTISSDTEYVILENIYDSASQKEPIRQRDLAQIAGASLGMTNSILKRLAQKGWISVKKLNSRNIQYAVTIEGINEIIHRSYRYFKNTIRNVVYFREILENLILQASRKGSAGVILVGNSDLDFIIEHTCHRHGLRFIRISITEEAADYTHSKTLKIFSENITETPETGYSADIRLSLPPDGGRSNSFYISRLIIRQAAVIETHNNIQNSLTKVSG